MAASGNNNTLEKPGSSCWTLWIHEARSSTINNNSFNNNRKYRESCSTDTLHRPDGSDTVVLACCVHRLLLALPQQRNAIGRWQHSTNAMHPRHRGSSTSQALGTTHTTGTRTHAQVTVQCAEQSKAPVFRNSR